MFLGAIVFSEVFVNRSPSAHSVCRVPACGAEDFHSCCRGFEGGPADGRQGAGRGVFIRTHVLGSVHPAVVVASRLLCSVGVAGGDDRAPSNAMQSVCGAPGIAGRLIGLG